MSEYPLPSKKSHKVPKKKGARRAVSSAAGDDLAPAASTTKTLQTATRAQVSQYAIPGGIRSGTFEDVKFYLFSRRNHSGLVDTTRPLYANSALLRKASPHFDIILSSGFVESEMTSLDTPFPVGRACFTDEYDYYEDSDLDDNDDCESNGKPEHTTAHTIPERTVPSTPAEPTLSQPSVADSGKQTHTPAAPEKVDGVDPEMETNNYQNAPVPRVALAGRKGRVVYVPDFAYRTWEAFIFYTFFGTVSFAPLGSQTRRSLPAPKPYDPPLCSPKSMYRLAEKYGIEELKELSLRQLETCMENHNVLVELFSSFTLTYAAIQDAEVEYLRAHLRDKDIQRQIPEWLQALEEGKMPRGSGALVAKILAK
ncbi:hypothetical protein C8Q77DRAFT_1157567 [Trametes polyzona]|nr:hypothetical protein C8Q77DRAFT_1157567 [Trametes polyzona]